MRAVRAVPVCGWCCTGGQPAWGRANKAAPAPFNAWPVGLVIVVPITTRDRGFAHHIRVAGGGLDRPSFAMPEYLRSVAQRRLQRRLGTAEASTLAIVDDWLRRLTGLQ